MSRDGRAQSIRRAVRATPAAALLAMTVAGGVGAAAPAPVSQADPFEDCSVTGPGTLYKRTAVEPMVASAPSGSAFRGRLAVAWQQDRWSNGGSAGIVAAVASDGGHSWSTSTLPFNICASSSVGYARATDPWVSIGPDGAVYAVASAFTPDPNEPPGVEIDVRSAILAVVSRDGGSTWGPPQTVQGVGFTDKPSIAADPTRPGVAYVVWQEGPSTWFSRTSDWGATWSTPRVIVTGKPGISFTNGNQILVDPRTHYVYDFFEYGLAQPPADACTACRPMAHALLAQETVPTFSDYIAVVHSANGGRTWSSPTIVGRVHHWYGAHVPSLRTGDSLPSAAYDPKSRRFYVAWQDWRKRYRGVVVAYAPAPASRWSRPAEVPLPMGHAAFNPALAADARGVAVTYYLLTIGTAKSVDSIASFRVAAWPRGSSAHCSRTVARGIDLAAAAVSGGYFVGDYDGLTGLGSEFVAAFVRTEQASTGPHSAIWVGSIAAAC